METHWAKWIRTADDLSQEALARQILETTVFGGLLQKCGDEEELLAVTFSESMEQEIFEILGLSTESFRRLLRNVVRTHYEASRHGSDEIMKDAQGLTISQ